MSDKINILKKLESFDDLWSPKIVAELNDQYVKLVKFKGEYVWHHHECEDEMFLVIKGKMDIHLRDRIISLNEGEFYIVNKGIEHKPVANDICEVLLFEPVKTRNTGNVDHKYTIEPENLENI